MRLRRKPWIDEAVLEFKDFFYPKTYTYTEKMQNNWHKVFDNTNPIYVELGTGKGKFITEMAEKHRDINFIGIELQQDVLYYAGKKVAEKKLENVRLLVFNIEKLDMIFGAGEISRFFINFCDPWPKERHKKRRLTHHNFFPLYEKILKEDGEIHFKTDNRPLFDFSLEEFKEFGASLKNISYDLHSENWADNIMTEYEAKFSQKGEKINRVEVSFTKEVQDDSNNQ